MKKLIFILMLAFLAFQSFKVFSDGKNFQNNKVENDIKKFEKKNGYAFGKKFFLLCFVIFFCKFYASYLNAIFNSIKIENLLEWFFFYVGLGFIENFLNNKVKIKVKNNEIIESEELKKETEAINFISLDFLYINIL